ncbi:helix-turn-helix domain-containing protein [Edwardsiella piscicida]|uniref:helix-turn-helix domain-containing protein n=1 Tax=Edwardsiella piscicida TaxID=1263550 RepID=UPI000D522D7C|nr:helix-turn-helix domain-containing protein [Edwardsiella piscicida]UCQ29747.1 helix-turn-helix domain-containing protein [Edwardsiella piscicida]
MTPEQIKEARQLLGFSQAKMCKALGLTSVMTYAKWEQGCSSPNAAAISAIEMLLYMHSAGVLDGWLSRI